MIVTLLPAPSNIQIILPLLKSSDIYVLFIWEHRQMKLYVRSYKTEDNLINKVCIRALILYSSLQGATLQYVHRFKFGNKTTSLHEHKHSWPAMAENETWSNSILMCYQSNGDNHWHYSDDVSKDWKKSLLCYVMVAFTEKGENLGKGTQVWLLNKLQLCS